MNISPPSPIHDHLAPVVANRSLGGSCFALTLAAPPIAAAARPGQFVMLRFPECRDPLLPRPMSIARVGTGAAAGQIDILHKVVGRATAMLSGLKSGDRIRMLGPLGRPFAIPPPGASGRALMVAGGIGVAIFPFLAVALGRSGWTPGLLFGGRSAVDLIEQEWFRSNGVEVLSATEDGSAGRKGKVTVLLEEALQSGGAGILYACGPEPMLRAVAERVNAAGVPGQIAMEAAMGCGIGACLGCVAPVRSDGGTAYARVCMEGPIFDARDLSWE